MIFKRLSTHLVVTDCSSLVVGMLLGLAFALLRLWCEGCGKRYFIPLVVGYVSCLPVMFTDGLQRFHFPNAWAANELVQLYEHISMLLGPALCEKGERL